MYCQSGFDLNFVIGDPEIELCCSKTAFTSSLTFCFVFLPLFFYYYRLHGSITNDDLPLVLVVTSFSNTEVLVIPSLERVKGRIFRDYLCRQSIPCGNRSPGETRFQIFLAGSTLLKVVLTSCTSAS